MAHVFKTGDKFVLLKHTHHGTQGKIYTIGEAHSTVGGKELYCYVDCDDYCGNCRWYFNNESTKYWFEFIDPSTFITSEEMSRATAFERKDLSEIDDLFQ